MTAGRLLTAQMRDVARETPARIAERIRHRRAAEQAVREREARFPALTSANAAEAIAWQERRIAELCAAHDCPVAEECGGASAAACLAFTVTQFGLPLLDGPICGQCAKVRWSVSVVIAPAPEAGDPDAPCSSCGIALKHALCEEDDGAVFESGGAICRTCTDDLRRRESDAAERARDDAINRRLDEARGK